jgi:hypothetical protein
MSTKTLNQLRAARHDPSLRVRLLGDARYLRKVFGWSVPVTMAALLVLLWAGGITHARTLHELLMVTNQSTCAVVAVFLSVATYDKFAERVTFYEAMGEDPPPEAPSLTLGKT